MSLLGTDACQSVKPPTVLSFTSASLSTLIGTFTVIGNSLVLLAILIDPKKKLRTPFNCFVASLALADLTVGLVAAPVLAAFLFIEGLNSYIPPSLRLATHLTVFISSTASLLSLTALAIDRYVAITSPLKYRARVNNMRAAIASVFIWLLSASLTMVYFLVGYNIYRFVFANTAVLTTFGVVIFTYVRIFRSLRLHVEQCKDLVNPVHGEENLAIEKRKALRWEAKVTKTLVIVLVLFMLCYVPSCVCIYIINLCVSCDCVFIHWIRDLQLLFVLTNSAVNPVVYALRLKSFRDAFKRILRCNACRACLRPVVFTVTLSKQESSLDISTTASYALKAM